MKASRLLWRLALAPIVSLFLGCATTAKGKDDPEAKPKKAQRCWTEQHIGSRIPKEVCEDEKG